LISQKARKGYKNSANEIGSHLDSDWSECKNKIASGNDKPAFVNTSWLPKKKKICKFSMCVF
jgi:hypothetical protein